MIVFNKCELLIDTKLCEFPTEWLAYEAYLYIENRLLWSSTSCIRKRSQDNKTLYHEPENSLVYPYTIMLVY